MVATEKLIINDETRILKPATEWEKANLTGIIYLWTCKINGKRLVGLSRNTFYDRYGENPNTWYHQASSKHFRNALLKHGSKNFVIEILEYNQFIPSLQCLESYYIAKFKSNDPRFGYNKTTGGEVNFTPNTRKTTSEFISEATRVHGNRYRYHRTAYKEIKGKVEIYCPVCQTYFWQAAQGHLEGKGCPNCYGNLRIPFVEFVVRAESKYGKDYIYCEEDYGTVMDKIKIKHTICGTVFLQSPYHHIGTEGVPCPYCNDGYSPFNVNGEIYKRKWVDRFLDEAKSLYGELYDYSKIKYIPSGEKLEIGCPKHGWFLQTKFNHLTGFGCPKCSKERGGELQATPFNEFLERAKNKFGNKFEYYIEDKPFRMRGKKIKIIHRECNTTFYQEPYTHLSGRGGCPICRNEAIRIGLSKGVIKLNILTNEVIEKYISSYQASIKTGLNARNIRDACQYNKEMGGYKWKYEKQCNTLKDVTDRETREKIIEVKKELGYT